MTFPATRGLLIWAWGGAAAMLVFTGVMVWRACVDVPLWDDFDAFLGYLLDIDAAETGWERLQLTFAFHNEHRTFTCRASVWLIHALGGVTDFRVMALLSAAMAPLLAALLVLPIADARERAVAALVAAALLFNLQHWENLFWGGSGCGHLVVLPPSVAALLLLRRATPGALAAALFCAALAVYSLAQGFAVLVVGLFVLVLERRRRDTVVWSVGSLLIAIPWFMGRPPGLGEGAFAALEALRFWLGLLGAPVALGSRAAAPWMGAGVLGLVGWTIVRGEWARRPYHASVIAFALVALGLITLGRVSLDTDGFMVSRYRILSALAIAPAAWMAVCAVFEHSLDRRVRFALCGIIGAYAANEAVSNAWRADDYRTRMLAAAAHFAESGTLEGAPTELYYDVPKAERILQLSKERGIFDLEKVVRREESR